MQRLKRICSKIQYYTALLALCVYILYWNLLPDEFVYAFLILGPICMMEAVFSVCLLIISKKDIEQWQDDAALAIGAIGLVLLHAFLLIVLR